MKMTTKMLIKLPGNMMATVNWLADHEHRNRADLVREALRRYIANAEKEMGHACGKLIDLKGDSNAEG